MKKILNIGHRTSGFTLVELMVVIAIIGILATVLFPAVTGYIKRAKDTAKMNELRNITTAINAYWTDHETYQIPGVGWMGGSQGWVNYKDGTAYTKTIAEGLEEYHYLPGGGKFIKIVPATYSSNPVVSNTSPCVNISASQDLYMYYFDNTLGRYSLSTYINYPSDKHIATILDSFNGSGTNGTCTRYGRNYSIGN
ncbi:MAG: type II secretion system protein [Candidatus Gracilibacteria bacterium]|nr:type II secretion system protein [Candidatus Gracilibacteria bacterium]